MHALVVGGTGMLKGVSLWLAGQGYAVSLLARRPERVGPVPGIHPLPVDYRDKDRLSAGLRGAIALHGPVVLAVCSIDRSAAPEALGAVAEELARSGSPFRLLLVRGSAAAHPTSPPGPALPNPPELCRYQEVILGWVDEGAATRWLTHPEIAQGVIEAIKLGAERSVVGTVRPWERRPGY